MSEVSDRFRKRAYDCRNLARNTRNLRDRAELEAVADDVDDEADRIDLEDAAKDSTLVRPKNSFGC